MNRSRFQPSGSERGRNFNEECNQQRLDFDSVRNPDKQGFAAFGKVTNGKDVVREIQKLKDREQYLEKPMLITSIKRIN